MSIKTIEEITLAIEGMTCASCISHVTHALENVSGVEKANVNLATEKATVRLEAQAAGLDTLFEAVKDAGYRVRTNNITLAIGGMTLASHASHVERAIEYIPGVISTNANLRNIPVFH